jgi:tetratricopeptide (TPR) repeat protein
VDLVCRIQATHEIRALWDYDDPAGSEAKFREYDLEPFDQDIYAEILTQVGRAQGLQRKFDEARETLTHWVEAYLDDEDSPAAVARWLELGRVENSAGNPEEAVPCFMKAYLLAKHAGYEFLAIDAAHMLAIVKKGSESLEWNETAIAMAEAATDPKARNWLGSLLNNTGWSYYSMEVYWRALEVFGKALAFREEQGKVDNIRIARYCIAKTMRALGQVEESLARQRELEQELLEDRKQPGYNWEEIGECLLLLERETEAAPYFAKAYGVLSKDEWIVADEPERLERLKSLGNVS